MHGAKMDDLGLSLGGTSAAEVAFIVCEEGLMMLGNLRVEVATVMGAQLHGRKCRNS